MINARLDGTGTIWATDIHERDREIYRNRVTCPDEGCQTPLGWRKRSRDGKSPTFFGKHEPGCSYRIETESHLAEREIREVDIIVNTNEELQIRLQPTGDQRKNAHAVKASSVPSSQSHVLHDAERARRVGTTGLRPLLRKLLADPRFRESRMPLTFSEGTRTTVREGCLHSGTATGSEFYRIVWGTIVRARTDIHSNGWFDSGSGPERLPAVCARGEARPTLCAVAGVETFAELAGWHFIVESGFKRSKMGNPTAWIDEPAQIALVPPTYIHVR